jgi:hypothetical protein
MNINARFDLRQFATATFGARGAKVERSKLQKATISRENTIATSRLGDFWSFETVVRHKSGRPTRFRVALCDNAPKNTSVQKSPRVHLSQNAPASKMFLSELDTSNSALRT